MKLKPLNDRVVIEPSAAEEKTAGGIVLPEAAKEKPLTGKIVAVGPGKMNDDGSRIEMDVKVGDTVIYSRYGGTEVEVDGVEYLVQQLARTADKRLSLPVFLRPRCFANDHQFRRRIATIDDHIRPRREERIILHFHHGFYEIV